MDPCIKCTYKVVSMQCIINCFMYKFGFLAGKQVILIPYKLYLT